MGASAGTARPSEGGCTSPVFGFCYRQLFPSWHHEIDPVDCFHLYPFMFPFLASARNPSLHPVGPQLACRTARMATEPTPRFPNRRPQIPPCLLRALATKCTQNARSGQGRVRSAPQASTPDQLPRPCIAPAYHTPVASLLDFTGHPLATRVDLCPYPHIHPRCTRYFATHLVIPITGASRPPPHLPPDPQER